MQLAKLTVKEQTDKATPNPLYTVETVELDEETPAVKWVAASLQADGLKLTSDPPGRGALSLAQQVENFNRRGKEAAQDSAQENFVIRYLRGPARLLHCQPPLPMAGDPVACWLRGLGAMV